MADLVGKPNLGQLYDSRGSHGNRESVVSRCLGRLD